MNHQNSNTYIKSLNICFLCAAGLLLASCDSGGGGGSSSGNTNNPASVSQPIANPVQNPVQNNAELPAQNDSRPQNGNSSAGSNLDADLGSVRDTEEPIDSPTQTWASVNFKYAPQSDVFEQNTRRWMEFFETQMNAAIEPLNALENLVPETIDIDYRVCPAYLGANATYNPTTTTITICDQLVDSLFESFAGNHDDTIATIVYVLYHEVAHALVDVRNLPTAGNYESVADSVAVVLAAETGRSLYPVIAGLHLSDQAVSFADEHIGGEDRAGDIICWALGSDSNILFNPALIDETTEFVESGRNCVDEYQRLLESVHVLVPPARDLQRSSDVRPTIIASADPTPPKYEQQQVETISSISTLVNGDDFWFCDRDDGEFVGYMFFDDFSGVYVNVSYTIPSLPFVYEFLSSNSVALTYDFDDGSSLIEQFSDVRFFDNNTFDTLSNTDGYLRCERSLFTC